MGGHHGIEVEKHRSGAKSMCPSIPMLCRHNAMGR
jgi:hypothetical protein